MKRILSILAIFIIVLSFSFPTVLATESNETYDKSTAPDLPEESGITPLENKQLNFYSKVVITDSISYQGEAIDLYAVFQDQTEAISNLYKFIPDEMLKIEKQLDRGRLSEDNWEVYAGFYRDVFREDFDTYSLLMEFFDIFENKYVNIDIQEYMKLEENVKSEEFEIGLAFLLPFDSSLSQRINDEIIKERKAEDNSARHAAATLQPAAFSPYNAVQYASSYAINPNPSYINIGGGDCANFASQIRRAGGHPDTLTWYYKSSTNRSNAWSYSDNFVRFVGVSYTTYNFYNFSNNIYVGHFITYDKTNDGSWDHVGFVTSADDYAGTWGGKYYYDFKVAQHTSNYHAWVSSSTNGWETLDANNSNKYATCYLYG